MPAWQHLRLPYDLYGIVNPCARAGQVKIAHQLVEQPGVEDAVRVGDVFALLIEFYHSQGNMQQSYVLIEKMRDRNILLNPYLDADLIQQTYAAVRPLPPSSLPAPCACDTASAVQIPGLAALPRHMACKCQYVTRVPLGPPRWAKSTTCQQAAGRGERRARQLLAWRRRWTRRSKRTCSCSCSQPTANKHLYTMYSCCGRTTRP